MLVFAPAATEMTVRNRRSRHNTASARVQNTLPKQGLSALGMFVTASSSNTADQEFLQTGRASQCPGASVAGGVLPREEEGRHLRQQPVVAQQLPRTWIPATHVSTHCSSNSRLGMWRHVVPFTVFAASLSRRPCSSRFCFWSSSSNSDPGKSPVHVKQAAPAGCQGIIPAIAKVGRTVLTQNSTPSDVMHLGSSKVPVLSP